MLIYKDCIDESEGLQYTCDPCEITEGGGVRSLCLLKKGTTIPNPYTQLDIDILVGAGLMYVMPETRGSFDGGTPKMITGYGDNKERQIGNDYVLQVKDPTFAENYEFWQAVENVEDWNIAFRTETQLAVVSDDVTITTKAPAEEGIDTEVVWDIECKWFSKSKPAIQPYSGKFDTILQTLDVIYGGKINNGGIISLSINSGLQGYIKMPNGDLYLTDNGNYSDTYSGISGSVAYFIPNTATTINIGQSGVYGSITYSGNAELNTNNTEITEIIASNSHDLQVYSSPFLVNLVSTQAIGINATGCALSAISIGDILIDIHENRPTITGTFNFSAGTNALKTDIEAYIIAQGYSLPGDDVIDWFGNDCPDVVLTLRTP